MRYFVFTYQITLREGFPMGTLRTVVGEVCMGHNKFPSHGIICGRIRKHVPNCQEIVITNRFEFQSEEDYNDYQVDW